MTRARQNKLDMLIARHSVCKTDLSEITQRDRVLRYLESCSNVSMLRRNLKRWPSGTLWHEPILSRLEELSPRLYLKNGNMYQKDEEGNMEYRCSTCWQFYPRNEMHRRPTSHQDRESLCKICRNANVWEL